ncbi:MAG TPA: hypothetical protein PLH02_05135 [Bacillota bacterium]|nr:hypothetical protein [Bacillota bacterium]
MKKRNILLVVIIALLFGSSVAAYAYWDNLQQNTNGNYVVGYGVRLEVPTVVQDERALVPAESFYAAYEADYTTSYAFTYTLNLEDDLQYGMEADLAVDITDFQIAGIAELFNSEEGLFTVTVGTDEAAATTSSTGEWDFTDAFYYNHNTVEVTVTITLADNGSAGFDASDYERVAGKTTNFAIGFLLSNSNSSNQPAE